MSRFARMSDVAGLAGVSTMTVSRALNGNPNVSEVTRQRVLAAVERLRYQPNELARSLREQRSRQIGIIVPNLFDPFFAILANAISQVAQKHSYSVVLSTSNELPEAEFAEASRMLRRNVEGLVIIPAHTSRGPSLLLAHEFEQLPIVTLDRPIEGSRFDSILVENEHGARLGTEHLLSLGHKRVAYLGLTDDLYTMSTRHRGYTAAMEARGLKPLSTIVSSTLEDAMTKVKLLLSEKKAPTALFCANNLLTRHTLHVLQALGMHPPESIALAGFDDFETADLMRPGITVVCQPSEELGQTAAEVLFMRLNEQGSSRRGRIKILPTELIVRGSCGANETKNGKHL